MGFWSSLGKGLLKVGKVAAPIALGATGVGLPAAMAVGGGLNALDKKLSGGSWKGALGAGLLGAGTGALGHAGGAALAGKSNFLSTLGGKLGLGAKANAASRVNAVGRQLGRDNPGFLARLGAGMRQTSNLSRMPGMRFPNQQRLPHPYSTGGYNPYPSGNMNPGVSYSRQPMMRYQ